jgi:kinesin family protein 3/17
MASKKKAAKGDECVKVCVRVRPLSSKEKQDGRAKIATTDNETNVFTVDNPNAAGEPPKTFTFDHTFFEYTPQQEVFDKCGAHIVDAVMEGFNGTVFAYGQTGSGKTHTMDGPDGGFAELEPEMRGLIPRCFAAVFQGIESASDKKFLVRASYLEIYNEEIRDLLSKNPSNKLDLREDVDQGVYVRDLTSFVVNSAANCDHVMQAGKKNRSTGATAMNKNSSRSHSIFSVVVECQGLGIDGEEHICVGKLNLVDLAGSERQSKTQATGDRLKEATKINLSLSALGNVISALVDGKSKHIPYRDSKLTRLLQDSLGGNTKTVMIANTGPADYNYDETLTTLRYANRAKNIKNKPKINEDPKDAMLREFQDEIERLKQQIASRGGGGGGGGAGGEDWGADGKHGGGVRREVVEVKKVVYEEKLVIEKTGIEQAEVDRITADLAEKKRQIERATLVEQKELQQEQSALERSMERVQTTLSAQEAAKAKEDKASTALSKKLKAMENKLVMGGQLMDAAMLQEKALRKAQRELEERRRQEEDIARELAEKEENNINLEEQYKSLEEEAAGKTAKLKKLWGKFQAAEAEVRDVQAEWAAEKEGLLDSVRELQRELKLKQAVVGYFVPPAMVKLVEARARYDEKDDRWSADSLQMAGNARAQAAKKAARKSKGGGKAGGGKSKKGGGLAPTAAELAAARDPFPGGNPFLSYRGDGAVTADVMVGGSAGAADLGGGGGAGGGGSKDRKEGRKSRPKSASRSRKSRT